MVQNRFFEMSSEEELEFEKETKFIILESVTSGEL
jgi:hypothetical protein